MFIPANIVERLKQLSSEDVFLHLGGKIVSRHMARCFIHDDRTASLSFKNNLWHCFGCGKGGNAISLVMEHQGLDFVDACRLLCELYGIHIPMSDQTRKIKPIYIPRIRQNYDCLNSNPMNPKMAQSLIDNCDLSDIAKQFLFEDRKLDPKVIHDLHITSLESERQGIDILRSKFSDEEILKSGFAHNTKYGIRLRYQSPCLLFPYSDIEGNLVGLQSRYLMEETSTHTRFRNAWVEDSRFFNLPVLKRIMPNEYLYIAEGVTDCLAMLSYGLNAIAIPSAGTLPKVDLLRLTQFKLRMFPDNDAAGTSGFKQLSDSLMRLGAIISADYRHSGFKDFGDYYKSIK